MSEEHGKGEFHVVGDAEADEVIEFSRHAVMHNEMIGRVLRNMYKRIQDLEVEVAELKTSQKLKAEKPKRSGPQ